LKILKYVICKACLPLLKKAAMSNKSKEMGVEKAAILNMSSVLGSIERNTDGGIYAYRTSKVRISKQLISTITSIYDLFIYEVRFKCSNEEFKH